MGIQEILSCASAHVQLLSGRSSVFGGADEGQSRGGFGAEFGGRLAMAEALQIGQQDRVALAARECRDGVSDPAGGMRIVIAGGHGKIALLLERLLAGRGDQAVGLIRNPAQVAEVRQAGAEAVVCDLEAASAGEVAGLLSGADAVVFAAGAGPGSGAPRKDSVDRAAAVPARDPRVGGRRQPGRRGGAQHHQVAAPDRACWRWQDGR
jgi:hypothetical protein